MIVEDTDDHTTRGPRRRRSGTGRTSGTTTSAGRLRATDAGDYSPRASGVHVLLRLDESTYVEEDGNTTDDDHPISWCQRYDGGRSWYTGMGHTAASFTEADYLEHLLGGIEVSAGAAPSAECGDIDPDAPIVEALRRPDLRHRAARGAVQLVGDRPERDEAARAQRVPVGVRRREQRVRRQPAAPLHDAGRLRRGADRDRPGGQEHGQDDPDHGPPAGRPGTGGRHGGRPGPGQAPLRGAVRGRRRRTRTVRRASSSTEWDFGDDTGTQFGRVVTPHVHGAGRRTKRR